MSTIKFESTTVAEGEPRFEALVARAHRGKVRPLCLCGEEGVPMYVARLAEKYILKRMPGTGSLHAAGCGSYELPVELSGLGELVGSAIQEEVESGLTALKFDFSLSKRKASATANASENAAASVRTDGSKLTLRGCLHYLWEQAGLNSWTPAMAGKRSWGVVHRALSAAAESKVAKGVGLNQLLFIPEPFFLERRDEILARRLERFASIATSTRGARKLLILVGEVKEVAPARFGHKLVIKHLPDLPFMMAEDLHKRLQKRFASAIELWSSDESTHLLAIGTFGVSAGGIASLEEMSLMTVSSAWIPIDDGHDRMLVERLVGTERRFTKCLRYNLGEDRPLASAVLRDTVPKAVALYTILGAADDAYRQALQELIDESELAPWLWKPDEQAMPTLPCLHDYAPDAIEIESAVMADEETDSCESDFSEQTESSVNTVGPSSL